MNTPTGHSPTDLLNAPGNDRGRVVVAEAPGMNYRAMATCCESRRLSRRMRRGGSIGMRSLLMAMIWPVMTPEECVAVVEIETLALIEAV